MKTLILSLIILTSATTAQAYQSTFDMVNYNENAKMVDKFRHQASICWAETRGRHDYKKTCRLAVMYLGYVKKMIEHDRGSFTLELYDQFKEGVDTLDNAAGLAKEIQEGEK